MPRGVLFDPTGDRGRIFLDYFSESEKSDLSNDEILEGLDLSVEGDAFVRLDESVNPELMEIVITRRKAPAGELVLNEFLGDGFYQEVMAKMMWA